MRRLTIYAEHGEIIGRSRVHGTSFSGNERLIVLSMFRPAQQESALNRADFGLAMHMGCFASWHTG